MVNFCKYCGAKLLPNSKFCPSCGRQLSQIPSQPSNVMQDHTSKVHYQQSSPIKRPSYSTYINGSESIGETSRKRSKTNGGKNSSKKIAWLNIALAAILIVEACCIGFVRPGYLLKKQNDPYRIQPIIEEPPEDEAEEILTLESNYHEKVQRIVDSLSEEEKRKLAPGTPRTISLKFTKAEIEAVDPIKVKVSSENPVCTEGDIKVDFKLWNLDGEDTLLIRSLGKVYDSESGSELELYDFSLESGKDQFTTEVEITLPRPQGGNANGVVWYDLDNDVWKPTVYDVSDDGKNYIIYTDHFTLFGPEASDYVTPEMLSSDIARGLFCTGFSAEERSKISNTELWNRNIIVSDERLTALVQKAWDDQSFLKKLLATSNISPEASMKGGIVEFLGSYYSIIDKWHSVANVVKRTGAGNYFAAVSGLFLLSKLYYQTGLKNETVVNFGKENKYDIIGLTFGIVATLSLPVSGPAATCAAIVSAVISFGQDIEDWYTYDVGREGQVYQYFLQEDSDISAAYKETLYNVNGVRLKLDGTGWADEISMIVEQFKNESSGYASNQDGGVSFDSLVEQRIDEYLNIFWDPSSYDGYERDSEMIEGFHMFYNDHYTDYVTKPANEYERDKNRAINKWKEPDKEQRERIIKATKARLMKNIREPLYAIYKKYVDEVTLEYKEELQNTTLLFLNSTVVLEVKDMALSNDETFGSDSVYSEEPDLVEFVNLQDKPDFWPADMTANDYYRKKFHPYALEESNEIFACKMYYYMMYGAPTSLCFKGDEKKGRKEEKKTFTIPKDDLGRIIIEIQIEGEKKSADPISETETVKSYKMRTVVDNMAGFNENFLPDMFSDIRMPEDVQCSVSSSGRVEISAPELSREFTASDTNPPYCNWFYKKKYERTPINIVAQLNDMTYYDHKKYGKVVEATSNIHGFFCSEDTRSAKDGKPSYLDHYSYTYSENQINRVYVQGADGVKEHEISRITLEYDENNNLKSVLLELCCEYKFCSSANEEVEGQKKWETEDKYWRYFVFDVVD